MDHEPWISRGPIGPLIVSWKTPDHIGLIWRGLAWSCGKMTDPSIPAYSSRAYLLPPIEFLGIDDRLWPRNIKEVRSEKNSKWDHHYSKYLFVFLKKKTDIIKRTKLWQSFYFKLSWNFFSPTVQTKIKTKLCKVVGTPIKLSRDITIARRIKKT